MKVHLIGVNRRKGVSEKTGRDYDIAELTYAVPDETPNQKKAPDGSILWTYVGHGQKIMTLPIKPDTIATWKDAPFGGEVSLTLEPNPANPARNWVVGFNAA